MKSRLHLPSYFPALNSKSSYSKIYLILQSNMQPLNLSWETYICNIISARGNKIIIIATLLNRDVNKEQYMFLLSSGHFRYDKMSNVTQYYALAHTWFWRSQSKVSADGGSDDNAQYGETNHDHDLLLHSALTDW